MSALADRSPEALEPAEEAGSQSVRAQQRLRELILAGQLPVASRITEQTLVDLLGVSRTPVRSALMRLEQEGLLQALPAGGYAVRTFSEREVADAIELRGTLEGLAARLAAERGVPQRELAQARECLDQIDQVLREGALDEDLFTRYVQLNARFHRLLARLPGSEVLAREIERAASLPFASPSGFVGVQLHDPAARDLLLVAQHQHRQLLEAIAQREAGRAEALAREHSRIARHNLQQALRDPQARSMPGVRLIRPS